MECHWNGIQSLTIGQKLFIGLALFLDGIVSLTRGADYDYRSIS